MIAQDTGSAILGESRADIYFGCGARAGALAGGLRHSADFVVLLPRDAEGHERPKRSAGRRIAVRARSRIMVGRHRRCAAVSRSQLHAKPEPIAASDTRPSAPLRPIERRPRRPRRFRRSRRSITAPAQNCAADDSTSTPNSTCTGCVRPKRIMHWSVFYAGRKPMGESGDCRHRQRVGRRCGRRAATDGSAVAASACAARCRRRLWRSLRKHGGEGALYVRIRRSDKGRPASAKGAD